MPRAVDLARLSSAARKHCNAAIDGLSLLMAVTYVPQYRDIRRVT